MDRYYASVVGYSVCTNAFMYAIYHLYYPCTGWPTWEMVPARVSGSFSLNPKEEVNSP